MTQRCLDWDLGPRTAYDATMSQFRCTQCGHLMPSSEVASHTRLHHGIDGDFGGLDGGFDRSAAGGRAGGEVAVGDRHDDVDLIVDLSTERPETRISKGPESESTVNWATAALALVVVAVIGWAIFGGGDADAGAEAEGDEATSNADGAGIGTDETPAGDPNVPRSDTHLAADNIAMGFTEFIDGDQRFTVVYPSADGLQMLSAAGPTTPDVSVAFGFEQMARFPLISDGSRTWAVDPEDPTTSYLVSTQFEVVDTALEGRVAFIDTSRDPIRVGISSFGAWGAGFEVPDSSQILAVPGRGLLIMPQTGGTFIVTATGVDPVSDDSAVAASTNGEVYQRCDQALSCELYVTNPDIPDGLKLDLPVGSEISISPTGRFVASLDEDNVAWIFDTEDATTWGVGTDEVFGLGWAPDESFLAITTGSELLIASTEGDRTTAGLPLPTDPASADVLVVSTPA